MGKREKILVALMAVAVVYGAVELFFLSGRTGTGRQPDTVGLQAVADMGRQVAVDIEAIQLSDLQRYVLTLASAGWRDDFFLVLPETADAGRVYHAPEDPQVPFEYSGYLEVGKKRMAIINGMEYREGDVLEGVGFSLISVTPGNVVVEAVQNGRKIVVPYRE